MTSPLTVNNDALAVGVTAGLTAAGYPWNQLTKEWDRYLGETLGSLTSGTPWLTQGRSEILAGILTALGGSGNARTMSEVTLMALIIDVSSKKSVLEDGSGDIALEDGSGVMLAQA